MKGDEGDFFLGRIVLEMLEIEIYSQKTRGTKMADDFYWTMDSNHI